MQGTGRTRRSRARGSGAQAETGLPVPRAGSFFESFLGGKVGKKRGIYSLPYRFAPFSPMLPGNLWVPSAKEASHPSWEPQVSRAAGGCPSGCSACQISASPSPALFIYLLNPPTLTARAGFLPVLLSHRWLHLLGSHHGPVPLGWVLWPWVRVTVGQLGKGMRAELATADCFLGRNSSWSLCQVPVLDAHGCSPS